MQARFGIGTSVLSLMSTEWLATYGANMQEWKAEQFQVGTPKGRVELQHLKPSVVRTPAPNPRHGGVDSRLSCRTCATQICSRAIFQVTRSSHPEQSRMEEEWPADKQALFKKALEQCQLAHSAPELF